MEQTRTTFQNQQIASVPSSAGLYAWYYAPSVVNETSVRQVLSSLIDETPKVSTRVELRYGITLSSSSVLRVEHGRRRESTPEVLERTLSNDVGLFLNFFKSELLRSFTRPLYVGVAKNLNTRVYRQHFLTLTEMWDDTHAVSRLLAIDPERSVQDVMKQLSIPHSFALEARVRKIAPRDLAVTLFQSNKLSVDIEDCEDEGVEEEGSSRRALERVLQLLSDPVCGRR